MDGLVIGVIIVCMILGISLGQAFGKTDASKAGLGILLTFGLIFVAAAIFFVGCAVALNNMRGL